MAMRGVTGHDDLVSPVRTHVVECANPVVLATNNQGRCAQGMQIAHEVVARVWYVAYMAYIQPLRLEQVLQFILEKFRIVVPA